MDKIKIKETLNIKTGEFITEVRGDVSEHDNISTCAFRYKIVPTGENE